MSKFNKLYIAIQIILIWAIVFTIPNSLLLQIVLWVNLLYTTWTLAYTEIINDDFIELEFTVKSLRQVITNEMMRLDAVVDEIEALGKKKTAKKTTAKKTNTKSAKKTATKKPAVKKEVITVVVDKATTKKTTAKKPAVKKEVKKAVRKK